MDNRHLKVGDKVYYMYVDTEEPFESTEDDHNLCCIVQDTIESIEEWPASDGSWTALGTVHLSNSLSSLNGDFPIFTDIEKAKEWLTIMYKNMMRDLDTYNTQEKNNDRI